MSTQLLQYVNITSTGDGTLIMLQVSKTSQMSSFVAKIVEMLDKSSLEYIKICIGLHNVKDLVGKKHCSFIDKLISDVRFSNLLLVYGSNALYRF